MLKTMKLPIVTTFCSLIVAFFAFSNAPLNAQELNCNNPQSQVEMTGCSGIAHEEADVILNEVYKRAKAQARSQDKYLEAGQTPSLILLRDAQRAWIKFRDLACSTESTLFRGGTGQSMLYLDCLTRLTRVRSEDLKLFAAVN